MIIMVTGGRDYDDWDTVSEALEPYAKPGNILIEGGADGADWMAYRIWTRDFQLPAITVPARWYDMGKPAGKVRNHTMVAGNSIAPYAVLRPDVVIAFAGGKGTQDARLKARVANIEVIEHG